MSGGGVVPVSGVVVVGAGMGRTGTSSLQAALQSLLGGTCYHMNQVKRNDMTPQRSLLTADQAADDADSLKLYRHSEAWLALAEQGPDAVDLDGLLAGCTAVVDFPATVFYRELMAKFPHAKVVLTVRDPQKWYESAWETIYLNQRAGLLKLLTALRFLSRERLHTRMLRACVWDHPKLFAGRFEDHDAALTTYNQWIEEVKATVPADRLLVYDVKEGWAPLCKFLGMPVPNQEFPRTNDKAMFQGRVRARTKQLLRETLFVVGVPALAVFVGLGLTRLRRHRVSLLSLLRRG